MFTLSISTLQPSIVAHWPGHRGLKFQGIAPTFSNPLTGTNPFVLGGATHTAPRQPGHPLPSDTRVKPVLIIT